MFCVELHKQCVKDVAAVHDVANLEEEEDGSAPPWLLTVVRISSCREIDRCVAADYFKESPLSHGVFSFIAPGLSSSGGAGLAPPWQAEYYAAGATMALQTKFGSWLSEQVSQIRIPKNPCEKVQCPAPIRQFCMQAADAGLRNLPRDLATVAIAVDCLMDLHVDLPTKEMERFAVARDQIRMSCGGPFSVAIAKLPVAPISKKLEDQDARAQASRAIAAIAEQTHQKATEVCNSTSHVEFFAKYNEFINIVVRAAGYNETRATSACVDACAQIEHDGLKCDQLSSANVSPADLRQHQQAALLVEDSPDLKSALRGIAHLLAKKLFGPMTGFPHNARVARLASAFAQLLPEDKAAEIMSPFVETAARLVATATNGSPGQPGSSDKLAVEPKDVEVFLVVIDPKLDGLTSRVDRFLSHARVADELSGCKLRTKKGERRATFRDEC